MSTDALTQTLAQARTAWLAGDRAAWSRYAACLSSLRTLDDLRTAPPLVLKPSRAGTNSPAGTDRPPRRVKA